MVKHSGRSSKRILLGAIIGLVLIAAIVAGILLLRPAGKDVRLKLTPQEQTMTVGQTLQLQLTDEAAEGQTLQAQWRSSAPSAVSVDENGLVTAVASGTARITASVSVNGVEYTAAASITVSQGTIDQTTMDGAVVPEVERQFLISDKTANVTDFPMQGAVNISDAIKDTYMVFAAGKGTDLHSDAWELTGTITKEDMTKTLFMSFGVYDENGNEQWFCILDECMSLQRYWNWWDTRYEADGSHVVTNQVSRDFFDGNRADLSFKIVVKDDIFRAYFGTEPSELTLAWELPLTEETFGGFAAGSKYQLAINTVDPNNMLITDLKTVTGDAVEFDSQQMPGPAEDLLSVWDGEVSFHAGTGKYTMGEGDATAMTPGAYRQLELTATFCPDVWPIQGFAIRQGQQLVTFRFGSEGYDSYVIKTAINGTDGPYPATNFDFSLVGGFRYEMKLTFDGEYINFFTQKNGQWVCINMEPISLTELLGEDYDPDQGVCVGIAGFSGCGRQFENIRLSEQVTTLPDTTADDKGPLGIYSGNVVYDAAAGMYIMGDGHATAVTEKAYTEAELSVTFCPNTWPIQGFAVKQGDNVATLKFGSEGYGYSAIVSSLNGGADVNIPTGFGFSLYGAVSYQMKLTFDGEYINLLTEKDGVWQRINQYPISAAELLGSDYDAEAGICVGIAGFDSCGRQFRSVAIAEKVTTVAGDAQPGNLGPLPVLSGEISYDSIPGTYYMGTGDATALTDKTYQEVDISATFCPDVWPIQGFALQQGQTLVTLKFGSEGYNATQVQIYRDGTLISAPELLYEFSLYGANSYDIKLICKDGEAWLYFKLDGEWTQLSKYPIVLADVFGAEYDSTQGIAVGIAGFDGCGRQIKNVVISQEVTLTPQLGIWDHYGALVAELRAEEYAQKGEDGVTTVFVGDSFMDPSFWTSFVGDMSGREALTLGIGGSTAEDWLGYIDEEIFLHDISPKNIVFNLGNNDLHNDGDLNVYLDNMKALLETVHALAPDSKLFMFSVAHRTGAGTNDMVDQANALMQQWCEEQGWVTFVDISGQLTTDMLSDGIHPRTEYYKTVYLPALEAAGCVFAGEIVDMESVDQLPVHSGNVTFNENTGMYVMGEGDATAMTEKVYTDAELTVTFCPDTWPVQGFAVKQGSQLVTFKFGSEGYDTNHIMTAVNGTAVASNPATAFDFSLVGAYSYELKLTYAEGYISFYLKEGDTWKQINASPISLADLIGSGFDGTRGISVGIAGFYGCGRQFSDVSVTGTEGSAEPPVDTADPLPVHSGNVTFNENTGMYVMGEGDATAMTEKVYTDAELTATFCPDTWPVQGFAVKQGSQLVTFKFGSEGYDTNHIMTAVNGTAVASNPATAFDFSLVGAYSYELKLTYAEGYISFYLKEGDTWKQINASPISLADLIGSGFDGTRGISVGIAGFYGCGRQFSNVTVTGTEGVPGEDSGQEPAADPDILTEKNNMDFLADAGLYYATGAAPYAVVPDTATGFTLEADFLGNGQGWPIMGFAIKQGDNWAGFYLDTVGGNSGANIHVFNRGVASYNYAIPISPALQMGSSSNVRLKLVYADGTFNFYIKNGEEWKLLNANPYTLEELNAVCGNVFTADGFQVGVAGYDGYTGAFSNAVYTEGTETAAEQ